jgi:hypothetical protein
MDMTFFVPLTCNNKGFKFLKRTIEHYFDGSNFSAVVKTTAQSAVKRLKGPDLI